MIFGSHNMSCEIAQRSAARHARRACQDLLPVLTKISDEESHRLRRRARQREAVASYVPAPPFVAAPVRYIAFYGSTIR